VIDARAKRAAGRISLATQGDGMPPRPMVVRMIANAGARPWGIAVGSDGKLYTANGPSNDVSVIDPDSGRVLARVAVGRGPWGIAIDR
jgi:YVTN family beta-propeller protein